MAVRLEYNIIPDAVRRLGVCDRIGRVSIGEVPIFGSVEATPFGPGTERNFARVKW